MEINSLALTGGPETPLPRRRGRPPGAKSKRSLDLARYIEAQFGGQTPGQQAAALSMVSAAELRQAKAKAKELRILDHGLQPLMLAMAVKAQLLSAALGCDPKEAWLLLQREREGLMPYVHQKRAQAAPEKAPDQLPIAYMIPDGPDGQALPDFSGDTESEVFELLDVSPGAPA